MGFDGQAHLIRGSGEVPEWAGLPARGSLHTVQGLTGRIMSPDQVI